MTKREEAKLSMYGLVQLFLTSEASRFTGFARLVKEIDNFKSQYTSLRPQITTQSAIITGIIDDKSAAFDTLQRQVVKAARKALVWANDTGNKEAVAIFDISASGFINRTKTKMIALAKGIAAELAANAATLAGYNVTSANITAINNAIAACEDRATAPEAAVKSKKTATTTLKTALKAIDTSLSIIDDLLISEYADSDSELVTGYRNNRRIDEVGTRHTGISATITDAATGKTLEGATLTIDTLNKTATTDMDGMATLSPMKSGSYHVRFAAAGYMPQTQDMKVSRGKVVEVRVGLVKG